MLNSLSNPCFSGLQYIESEVEHILYTYDLCSGISCVSETAQFNWCERYCNALSVFRQWKILLTLGFPRPEMRASRRASRSTIKTLVVGEGEHIASDVIVGRIRRAFRKVTERTAGNIKTIFAGNINFNGGLWAGTICIFPHGSIGYICGPSMRDAKIENYPLIDGKHDEL